MNKNPYEAPKVFDLGSVEDLTKATPEPDKCSGSGDAFVPAQVAGLSPTFSNDCP